MLRLAHNPPHTVPLLLAVVLAGRCCCPCMGRVLPPLHVGVAGLAPTSSFHPAWVLTHVVNKQQSCCALARPLQMEAHRLENAQKNGYEDTRCQICDAKVRTCGAISLKHHGLLSWAALGQPWLRQPCSLQA